jgi:hypothetical protein
MILTRDWDTFPKEYSQLGFDMKVPVLTVKWKLILLLHLAGLYA